MDFSKSGFGIVGLGFGDNRPTFTCGNLAAGDDMFDFAGDDVLVYNIKYAEASSVAGSDAVAFNVSGDNFHIEGCYIELGAETLTFLTHDTTAKKGLTVVNNIIVGTAAGVDAGVRIELTHTYANVSGNTFLFAGSSGCDTGAVILVSGTTASGGHIIRGNTILGLSAGSAGCNMAVWQAATPTYSGLVADNYVVSGAGGADLALGNTPAAGLGFINNMVTEAGASVPGTVDNAGDPIALTPAA